MPEVGKNRSRWWGRIRGALDITATIATLVAAGAVVWAVTREPSRRTASPGPPIPTDPVSFEGAPILGDPSAKVVLIEFSDFECPFCGRFAKEILPAIKTRYIDTGVVQFGFLHLPLEAIHSQAVLAATAAVCAQEQDRFWEFHDLLFQDVTKLKRADIDGYARRLSLNMAQFEECLKGGAASSRVSVDQSKATELGLRGTPALLVGSRVGDVQVQVIDVVAGLPSIDALSTAIKRVKSAN